MEIVTKLKNTKSHRMFRWDAEKMVFIIQKTENIDEKVVENANKIFCVLSKYSDAIVVAGGSGEITDNERFAQIAFIYLMGVKYPSLEIEIIGKFLGKSILDVEKLQTLHQHYKNYHGDMPRAYCAFLKKIISVLGHDILEQELLVIEPIVHERILYSGPRVERYESVNDKIKKIKLLGREHFDEFAKKFSPERFMDILIEEIEFGFLKIPYELLRSKTHKRKICEIRYMFFHLVNRTFFQSMYYRQIGEKVGHPDHATVLHGIKRHAILIEKSLVYRKKFEQIEKSFFDRLCKEKE